MGARCSKRRTYNFPITNIQDLIFYEGCIGLTAEMYDDDDQINAGPGLVVPFQGRTLNEILRLSTLCIAAASKRELKAFMQLANNRYTREARMANKAAAATAAGSKAPGGGTAQTAAATGRRAKGSKFESYDARADFVRRLRELLEILNMKHWEKVFVADYDVAVARKMAADGDLPPALRKLDSTMSNPDVLDDVDLSKPQLPALSAPKVTGGAGDAKPLPYYLLGPAYLIISNDSDTKSYIEAYMFFPSMTKDMQPAPNYDFMAKSHQWLHRLLNDDMYKANGAGCEQPCLGTPKAVSTKSVKCDKHVTIMACGCRTDSDKDKSCFDKRRDYRRQIKKPDGSGTIRSQPIMYQYTVYRMNLSNPSISKMFKADSSSSLQLNIIPSDWDVYPGCKYTFLSRNRQFFTRLETAMVPIPGTRRGRGRRATQEYEAVTRFGLYFTRRDDVQALCKKKQKPKYSSPIFSIQASGYPKRAVIEGTSLNIYTAEEKKLFGTEDLAWSMKIAKDGAEEPISIVLLDNGKFDVVDKNNASVISAEFSAYVESGQKTYRSKIRDLPSDSMAPADGNEKFDPAAEYARRLRALKHWLRIRNLLREVDEKYGEAAPQVRPVIQQESGEFIEFDPNQDYEARYQQLVAELIRVGLMRPSASAAQTAAVSLSPPRRGARGSTNPGDTTFVAYNKDADFQQRLQQLQQAIHR